MYGKGQLTGGYVLGVPAAAPVATLHMTKLTKLIRRNVPTRTATVPQKKRSCAIWDVSEAHSHLACGRSK